MTEIRKIILEMFQKIKIDYDKEKDKFTGLVTLPDEALDTALTQIKAEINIISNEDIETFRRRIADLDTEYNDDFMKVFYRIFNAVSQITQRLS